MGSGTAAGVPSPVAAVLRDASCAVELRYVGRGSATSLMVTDLHTGATAVLDATELESLARASGNGVRDDLGDIGGRDAADRASS